MSANRVTKNALYLAALSGCLVWRNNTTGIFDGMAAAKKIWNVVQSGRVTPAEIKKAIQSSYRKSHETVGASDIMGVLPDGRFLAIEVKAGKDRLSIEQNQFLKAVADKGGLAIVLADKPEGVKLAVLGSERIKICTIETLTNTIKTA